MPNGYALIQPGMFEHWDKMDPAFLHFLDLVLQGAGYTEAAPPVITSDWRAPQQEAALTSSGGVPGSLHLVGCAVDLRMPRTAAGLPDRIKLGLLVDSICLYRRGVQTEFEIDITPNDEHLHIGQWIGKNGLLLLEPTCRHTLT